MQRFTDLKVWQRGHALVLDIYKLTRDFPAEELYGMTSQLRRAALSVPTNIVEGSRRVHAQDFARFLNLGESSIGETEYLLMASRDLGYLSHESAEPRIAEAEEIFAMLNAFRQKVEQRPQ